MRLDFVKVFRDSTNEMLQQIVGPVDETEAIRMNAMPLAGRDVTGLDLFRCRECVVGLSRVQQPGHHVTVDFGALRLAVGAIRAADPGPLVPVQAEPAQRVDQRHIMVGSAAPERAVSVINDRGTRVSMEPPMIGDAALARSEYCFETLTFPVQTMFGEVRVNVMICDLD